MIRSMTAYGRAELQSDGCVLIAELRSVNHRYRDIVLKLPKNFQIFEEELKAYLSSKIGRGRVDVTIQVTLNQESSTYSLGLNLPLVRSYCKIIEELAQEFGIERRIQPESILQLKDAIVFQPEPVDLERYRPGLREVLVRAFEPFDRMRVAEGEAIKTISPKGPTGWPLCRGGGAEGLETGTALSAAVDVAHSNAASGCVAGRRPACSRSGAVCGSFRHHGGTGPYREPSQPIQHLP